MGFLTSSGHFFIVLKASSVFDSALFVDAMAECGHRWSL